MLRRPGADVDGVAAVEHLLLDPHAWWPEAAQNDVSRSASMSYAPARTISAPLRRNDFEWYVAMRPVPMKPTRRGWRASDGRGGHGGRRYRSAVRRSAGVVVAAALLTARRSTHNS